jgi:uncharacterized membrane protein
MYQRKATITDRPGKGAGHLPASNRTHTAMQWSAAAVLAIAGLAFAPAPQAHADLRVCNSTESLIGVAIGYHDGRAWVSEGWWNVDRNSCRMLLEGDLISRFYYVYAIDYDKGGEWSEDLHLVHRRQGIRHSRQSRPCEERGFHANGFMEVDTGEQRSWTVQLTEPTTCAACGVGIWISDTGR